MSGAHRWISAGAGLLIVGLWLIELSSSERPTGSDRSTGSSYPVAPGVSDENTKPSRPLDRAATKPSASSAGDPSAGSGEAHQRIAVNARPSARTTQSFRALPPHSSASLWSPAGEVDWPSDHIRGGLVSEAEAVLMTADALASLGAGDRTFMEIPQVGGFTAIVDATSVGPNGDRSWQGHLTDGSDYSVTFTAGDAMSFATIVTPKGTYLLEARGEQGWIFRDELDQLIDPNQSDFVLNFSASLAGGDTEPSDDFLDLDASDGEEIDL